MWRCRRGSLPSATTPSTTGLGNHWQVRNIDWGYSVWTSGSGLAQPPIIWIGLLWGAFKDNRMLILSKLYPQNSCHQVRGATEYPTTQMLANEAMSSTSILLTVSLRTSWRKLNYLCILLIPTTKYMRFTLSYKPLRQIQLQLGCHSPDTWVTFQLIICILSCHTFTPKTIFSQIWNSTLPSL